MKQTLSPIERELEREIERKIVTADFLKLTHQVRSVINQSRFDVQDGLKTAGELLSDWLELMPSEIKVELGLPESVE